MPLGNGAEGGEEAIGTGAEAPNRKPPVPKGVVDSEAEIGEIGTEVGEGIPALPNKEAAEVVGSLNRLNVDARKGKLEGR